MNLTEEVGITLKSKETSSYPARDIYVCNYPAPGSIGYWMYYLNICPQVHAQVKHALAHLQDFIPSYSGYPVKVGIKSVDA